VIRATSGRTLVRFLAGWAGGIGLAVVAFGWVRVTGAGGAYFGSIFAAAFAAAILATVRAGRIPAAAGIATVLALLESASTWHQGPARAAAALVAFAVVGSGMLLVAILYHLLARSGVRIGKFLFMGPLLGGVYLAAGPAASFYHPTPTGATRWFLLSIFVGIVVGDGVGFGTEIAELFMGPEDVGEGTGCDA
jgi:hypothetical protein